MEKQSLLNNGIRHLLDACSVAPMRVAVLSSDGLKFREITKDVIRNGGEVVLLSDQLPARVLIELEKIKATHVLAETSTLVRLAFDPSATMVDLSSLQALWRSGPSASPQEEREIRAIFSVGLYDIPSSQNSFGQNSSHLIKIAMDAGEDPVKGVRRESVDRFLEELKKAVFTSMLWALQSGGLLSDPVVTYCPDTVLDSIGTAPRHRRLLGRWFRSLIDHLILRGNADSVCGALPIRTEEVEQAWHDVEALWKDGLGSEAFPRYLALNAQKLPELIRGEQKAVLLLFPQGNIEAGVAVYRDTTIAHYLNTALAASLHQLATRHSERLRILEIGGGTGATTETILNTVSEPGMVEYLFTDVSPLFLESAQRRFSHHSALRFGLFDMNHDIRSQGLRRATFDVIIAAGVLNNASDIRITLKHIASLLVPGGWLMITEPIREHLEILTSQAFMITEAEDLRSESDSTFLSLEQWTEVLSGAGFVLQGTLPGEDHALAPLGQRLLIASR